MGFVIDKRYRSLGIGSYALEGNDFYYLRYVDQTKR